LRAKIVSYEAGVEAEFAARSRTIRKNDNKVWRDFRRNPEGRGPRFSISGPGFVVARRSKMSNIRRSSLREPEKIGSRRHHS
jgi:hypothetical protein